LANNVETDLRPDDVAFLHDIAERVNGRMFGLEGVVSCLLCALATGGHVLLEGNPGLGKTALVKTLASALELPSGKSGRIQFTPDLMPADITGSLMPRMDDVTKLEFQKGPIFKWLLLADEINRATPKTQAAMLEAMAEKQVTVLGAGHSLVEPVTVRRPGGTAATVEPPFMVMATQNPIDQEGTYNLPEAQSDRFMFKLLMPSPSPETLARIVESELRRGAKRRSLAADLKGDDEEAAPEGLLALARLNAVIRTAEPHPLVSEHIRNLVLAGDAVGLESIKLSTRRKASLEEFRQRFIRYPLGPRAAFSLELGARAFALLRMMEAHAVHPLADLLPEAFARIAIPAIRHRLKLHRSWERAEDLWADEPSLNADQKQNKLLRQFIVHAAPEDPDYQATIEASLDAFLRRPY